MPTQVIKIDKLAKYLRSGQCRSVLVAGAITGMREAAAYMEGQVVLSIETWEPFPLVDRGFLKGSVRSFPQKMGARVEVGGDLAKYARDIEYGTRAYWIPLPPLIRWVARKGITNGNPLDVLRFARYVRRKIGENGFEPRPFFEDAFDLNEPVIKALVIHNVKKMAPMFFNPPPGGAKPKTK